MPPGLSGAVEQGRGRSPPGKGPGARPAPSLALLPGPGGSQPGPEGSEPPVWDGSPAGGGHGGERGGGGVWKGLGVVLQGPSPAGALPVTRRDRRLLLPRRDLITPRAGRVRLLADQLRFFCLSHRVLVPNAAVPTCGCCCSSTCPAGSSGWAGAASSRSPCLNRVRWLSRRSAAGFVGELGT